MGRSAAVATLVVVLSVVLGLWLYNSVYLPWSQDSARMDQLREAGLDEESAKRFNEVFKVYADPHYNQTILEFAKHYKENPGFALEVFNQHK